MMAAIKNQQAAMTLRQLLTGICATEYLPEIEILGLSLDSRKIEQGHLFVALEGQFDHGLAYAEAAVSRGAVAVLCDARFDQYCQQILSRIMTRVICVPVNDLQNKLAEIADKYYQCPSQHLFVCGVTGTDGKTSVSHFIAQAMNSRNDRAAIIGTLGNGCIDQLAESTHTTPDVISLQELMSDFRHQGVKNVAMEVSSHGLDQQRVSSVNFDVAVLTNISRDHLDYHGSIEAYRHAKKKLFLENKVKTLVLNADDSFSEEIQSENKGEKPVWLYGLNENEVRKSEFYACATNIENLVDGMRFVLSSSHGKAEVKVQLIGEFNVYNLLACFCVLIQSGMNFNHAVKRITRLKTVPGRMELIAMAEKPSVVIDYAHTPEAITQALINVRKHTNGKLICVFGCGGERDSGKRPLMAQAADQLADLVIITNDNPRNEDPAIIIDEIRQGISNELHLIIEPNREKAIEQAVEMAESNDLVLIAGKGHEEYQLIGNEKFSFSDKEVAFKSLEAIR